jgi:P4 family phage/plasmid primase-like protien
MTYDKNLSDIFCVREYAIGGTTNRHQFHSIQHVEMLKGKDDAFQSIYLHSPTIQEYFKAQSVINGKPSLTGYKEIVGSDFLFGDIDVKGDLATAQSITKSLIDRWERDFQVHSSTIRIVFSGNKGFHLDIPAELFAGFSPSKQLPQLQSAIVRHLAMGFENSVDLDIYYTLGLIRIENTKHGSSGLFAIPLTYEELSTLTIDQIKALAVSPRDLARIDTTTLTFVQSLVDLKEQCERDLASPVVVPQTYGGMSYTSCDPKKFPSVCKHCQVMAEIKRKSEAKELISHQERLTLGTVATAFGQDGVQIVHELLQGQPNYDVQKTAYYLQTMAQNAYKPTLCNTICGPDKLCDSIKAISRRSPIAFAFTYDSQVDEHIKKYVETYVLERVTRHFDNLIYATVDQTYYRYLNGVYCALGDDCIKAMLEDFLPYYLPKHLITNAKLVSLVDRLKTMRGSRYEGKFNTDLYRVNLRNGIFNLKTAILEPQTPEFKSTIQLPFSYDPKATSPVFDKFLLDIFNNDQAVVDYILRYWCYLLLPTYSFQKVLVWIGSGRNGKGTLSRIIQNMLGAKNISYVDLHDLAKKSFAAINLKDKLVNFSTELKTDDVELGMIKKLSGGDLISADVKFKDTVVFSNIARLIISANELPRFSDVGNAITQRFEFIKFPKEYNGAAVDTMLDQKLQKELPGIFNRVAGKINEITQPDGSIFFESPASIAVTKSSALSDLSTVIEFVEGRCKKDRSYHTYLADIYAKYKSWANDSGYRPVGLKHFRGVVEGTLKFKVSNCTRHHNSVCIDGIL